VSATKAPVEGSVSFVIPAFNEEAMVGDTLDAIRGAVEGTRPWEMVVVDNGSTDGTAQVASTHGARVVVQPGGTIAALRNRGVRETRGEFLVFLDADVVPTRGWGEQLTRTLQELARLPRTLTGGQCAVPADASWIERRWFVPRDPAAFSHVGTGHLLTTRAFFDEIGGFDESLETGEDYDFSRRAERAGGRIAPEPALVAEHRGFPRTVRQFVQREAWHGRSDFTSPSAILASRVALATLGFVAAHVALIVSVASSSTAGMVLALGAIATLCLGSSWAKYRASSWDLVLSNAAIYYLYFVGRTLSLLRAGRSRRGKG